MAATLNGGNGAFSSIMAANGDLYFGLVAQSNPIQNQYQTNLVLQNNGNVGI